MKIPPIVPTQEKTKTENLYESIIGERNRVYYLTKFEQFDQQGPGGLRASWNWSAFLCTGGWALYRKMYVWFFAFLGIAFLSSMFGKEGFIGWGVLVFSVPQIAFAIFANSLYHWGIKKKIAVAQLTINDESKLLEYLGYKGGVHAWVFLASVLLPVAGIIAILTALMIIQISTSNKNGADDPFPQDDVINKAPAPSAPGHPPAPASESAVDLFNNAVALRESGRCINPPKAIEYLNEAILLKPDFADAYIQRGIVYADMEQYQRAIRDYDKAITLQLLDRSSTPNRTTAYSNRGDAYANLGKHERAFQDYNAAILLKPDEAVFYNNRGAAYDYLGKLQRAIQDYDTAILLKPGEAVFYTNRGNAFIASGNKEEGCRSFNLACELGVCEEYERGKEQGICQ